MDLILDEATLHQTWMKRAVEYWDLQRRLFGFNCKPPSLHFTEVDGMSIITSAVEITAILPGRRISRKDWVQWRLKNPQAQ